MDEIIALEKRRHVPGFGEQPSTAVAEVEIDRMARTLPEAAMRV
ncbi:hypothetical protein [Aminobacter ciceronei]|uniref:Uncharacterized protein n=1 Tax=Aminobacter ciceronei TaxID=150723 RepID=A0ABR6C1M4_9HYPH|nr:hypothetical protein [Aminobacter ciceronei]MBA9018877.1 hypothetical protein [Aminobacter ciceronei]